MPSRHPRPQRLFGPSNRPLRHSLFVDGFTKLQVFIIAGYRRGHAAVLFRAALQVAVRDERPVHALEIGPARKVFGLPRRQRVIRRVEQRGPPLMAPRVAHGLVGSHLRRKEDLRQLHPRQPLREPMHLVEIAAAVEHIQRRSGLMVLPDPVHAHAGQKPGIAGPFRGPEEPQQRLQRLLPE